MWQAEHTLPHVNCKIRHFTRYDSYAHQVECTPFATTICPCHFMEHFDISRVQLPISTQLSMANSCEKNCNLNSSLRTFSIIKLSRLRFHHDDYNTLWN